MLEFALVLQLGLGLALPARSFEDLGRMYALGEVGDHDGDGVADIAVAGQRSSDGRSPMVVRVLSGATFSRLAEFQTEAAPPCAMVLHDPLIRAVDDLDGDGLREFAANGERALLLEGRSGAVVGDFGPRSFVWGLADDADSYGSPSLVIFTGISPGCGSSGRLASGRASLRDPRAWHRERTPWANRPPRQDGRTLARGPGPFLRGELDLWRVVVTSVSSGVDADENDLLETDLVVLSNTCDVERSRARLPFEMAGDEHGGCGEWRIANLGDVDRDGFEDFAAAVPRYFGTGVVCAISGGSGATLWSVPGWPEVMNPSVDLVRDRDRDGLCDLLISLCDGAASDAVQILSSRDGRSLASFKP